jgi:hypothetical protein
VAATEVAVVGEVTGAVAVAAEVAVEVLTAEDPLLTLVTKSFSERESPAVLTAGLSRFKFIFRILPRC